MSKNSSYFPWSSGGRIKAIVGHYGSGKTEISMAMAMQASAEGHSSMVVDLDIVNPFFRSAEQSETLAAHSVETISPPYALTGVDLPVLSAEILSVFERKEAKTVFDVGGDDAGAAALGRFKPQFDLHGCELIYVVNIYRPFSDTPERILDMIERISIRSRLKPSGLINNSNLGGLTEPGHVLNGLDMLRKVAERTNLPILASCAQTHVLERLPAIETPLFAIERLTKPEWMEV